AASVLREFPDLSSRLDEPMPGGAFGATPLLAAVSAGSREMIDVLLAAGADINARSHWWAGSFGVLDHDGELADFLIERGAIVDAHAAARLGRIERLRELLDTDSALVHARGGDGQTPLHFASTVEVASLLLERGADIDACDIDHESTPAQWMIRDRQPVARFLVGRGCRTDVLMAAALGEAALVQQHLDADPAAIRTTVSDRYFPRRDPRSAGSIYLWTLGANKDAHTIARELGHRAVFRLLMDRSPDSLKFAVACSLGDEQIARDLLSEDAALATRLSPDELSRLPAAAQENDTRVVSVMLGSGWPLDARGQHGATALHWAAFHGNAEMTRRLLARGAPIDVVDRDYAGTPMRWAIYGSTHGWHCRTGDYAGVVRALVEAGAPVPADADLADASQAVKDAVREARND
ncbi:MAG: ankyrin repeat domain-containing protein, partial [Vicinamibacterales bacterium]